MKIPTILRCAVFILIILVFGQAGVAGVPQAISWGYFNDGTDDYIFQVVGDSLVMLTNGGDTVGVFSRDGWRLMSMDDDSLVASHRYVDIRFDSAMTHLDGMAYDKPSILLVDLIANFSLIRSCSRYFKTKGISI